MAGGITDRRTHHKYVTSYVMVYKTMSHVTLPRMCELSPTPTLVAKNKRSLLSEYPLYNYIVSVLEVENTRAASKLKYNKQFIF
jgi:hypothetical protein